MVGANNSRKNNVMDALRIFYEKGLKYEKSRDFPKFDTEDNESWIEIEYSLSENERMEADQFKGRNGDNQIFSLVEP